MYFKVSTSSTDITPIKKRSLGVVKKLRRPERHEVATTNASVATMQIDETPMAGPSSKVDSEAPEDEPHHDADELAELRRLLMPPSIPGVEDWGIPVASEEPCDEELEVS